MVKLLNVFITTAIVVEVESGSTFRETRYGGSRNLQETDHITR